MFDKIYLINQALKLPETLSEELPHSRSVSFVFSVSQSI
jgi:hypothetical protein